MDSGWLTYYFVWSLWIINKMATCISIKIYINLWVVDYFVCCIQTRKINMIQWDVKLISSLFTHVNLQLDVQPLREKFVFQRLTNKYNRIKLPFVKDFLDKHVSALCIHFFFLIYLRETPILLLLSLMHSLLFLKFCKS